MSKSTAKQYEVNEKGKRKDWPGTKNLKHFKKRDPVTGEIDPRINTKGPPKKFMELRDLVQEILAEELEVARVVNGDTKDKKKIIKEKRTRLKNMILNMIHDAQAANKKTILEYGFGKVPDEVKVLEPVTIIIRKATAAEESGEATAEDE